MAKPTSGKKSPSVLVTDSRERDKSSTLSINPQREATSRHGTTYHSISTNFSSVESLLQNGSEIPSGQPRFSPLRKNLNKTRVGSLLSIGAMPQNVPGRTTKVTEKLVLIPETIPVNRTKDDGKTNYSQEVEDQDDDKPLNDTENETMKNRGDVRGKSYAERLSKAKRAERLARVTAYCTAQGYKTRATANFVKKSHGARTKLYDDCLYTVYHLPLLLGSEGIRIKSSTPLKRPGGKAVLDEEIERNELRDYHEGYLEDTDTYGVRDGDFIPWDESKEEKLQREEDQRGREEFKMIDYALKRSSSGWISPENTSLAEMFVFSYGVVVFWNFTEKQEKDILADLTFSNHEKVNSLVIRPLKQNDFEKEEFHFEYCPNVDGSRVFNDMITLRSGDHMIKLTMSHAIAQSTKLSLFEERMNQTMSEAKHIPKCLALKGQLGLSRTEILKTLGSIFKSRVDVNLSSNILDVPNFFWDSEPTLHPLYFAIREYLEIAPRIKTLNERCSVFLELAEILSDSIADTKMSTITWIIIFLIVISICVTIMEISLRSIIFERTRTKNEKSVVKNMSNWTRAHFTSEQLENICGAKIVARTFAEK